MTKSSRRDFLQRTGLGMAGLAGTPLLGGKAHAQSLAVADAGAPELAEATARVIEDPELRAAMIERGSRRGEEFIRDATPTGWLEALARVLRGGTAGTSTQPA